MDDGQAEEDGMDEDGWGSSSSEQGGADEDAPAVKPSQEKPRASTSTTKVKEDASGSDASSCQPDQPRSLLDAHTPTAYSHYRGNSAHDITEISHEWKASYRIGNRVGLPIFITLSPAAPDPLCHCGCRCQDVEEGATRWTGVGCVHLCETGVQGDRRIQDRGGGREGLRQVSTAHCGSVTSQEGTADHPLPHGLH